MSILAFALLLCPFSVELPSAQQPDPPEILWEDGPTSRYYEYGATVAWLGDVDGDLNDDYAVGSSGGGSSKVQIYSGASKTEIGSATGGIKFGFSLAALGDVNGDGIPDFAAGTPAPNSSTGEVAVVSGADFSRLYSLPGNHPAHLFGWSIAPIDDTDGDGVPDFLVLAHEQGGIVSLHSGVNGNLRFQIQASTLWDEFGEGLAGIHDYNGDGAADFLVGAPSNGLGLVTLYSGADGAELATLSDASSRDFGAAIAQLGDLNGDAVPDFAIGAPLSSRLATTYAGKVIVYSGSTLSPIRTVFGSSQSQKLGALLADAGDYNQDGVADLLIASPGADANGINGAGKVDLISGSNLAVLGTAGGTQYLGHMPTSLAGNGDGHRDLNPDFLIGNSEFGPQYQGRAELWGAPSPWLQVDNLVAGATASLSADLCQPGGVVQFWYSRQGGGPTQTPIGVVLLTSPYFFIGESQVNLSGRAQLSAQVPISAMGLWIFSQALEVRPNTNTRLSTGVAKQVQ